ncbi:MAG TPA: hypothetical protein VGB62_00515 [Allosphingosinicella sp.]|jgi:hypothetical protein
MLKRCLFALAALGLASCDAPPEKGASQSAPEPANATAPAPKPPAEPAEAVEIPEVKPVSTATLPEDYRGVWEETPADCAAPSEYRLEVTAGTLQFLESIGTVTAVTEMGDDAVSVGADYEGEGETWSEIRELRLSDGGNSLTVTGDGTMVTRVRCPKP